MYFIFTNKDDNTPLAYRNYQNEINIVRSERKYKPGLNVDERNKIDLEKYHPPYVYSEYSYLRVAILLNDLYSCNLYYYYYEFNYYYMIQTNRVLLSDRYYLYDPRTIKKFNIKVDADFIVGACGNGAVKFLEWWKNSGLPLEYDEDALSFASYNGYINVLEWWKNSGLPLKYDKNALYLASINGHVNVLEWWFKSGLELQYDRYILKSAFCKGHVNVLEWWFKSGLELQWDRYIFKDAFCKGHIHVIKWFMDNNFKVPLKYRLKVYYNTLKTNMKNVIKLH
jgi:hypothetical protein